MLIIFLLMVNMKLQMFCKWRERFVMGKYAIHKRRIIILAFFYIYGYMVLFPLILFPILIFSLFKENVLALLMGIDFILFALHSLVGYVCRWKHIYCSYQHIHRKRMTPNNICWAKMKKSDAYGIPVIFALLGIVLIIFHFYNF